jgi:hypothetical protein
MKTKLRLGALLLLCAGFFALGAVSNPIARAIESENQSAQLIAGAYYLEWQWSLDPNHLSVDNSESLWANYVYWTGRADAHALDAKFVDGCLPPPSSTPTSAGTR